MTATAITSWGAGQNWWSFMDNYGEKLHKKTDVHITLDQDVLQELDRLGVVRSRFINGLLRTVLFGEEPYFIQGRAERGVLEKHYLNLEILADEWYSAVVDDLKKVLEGEK